VLLVVALWHFIWFANYYTFYKDSAGYEKYKVNYAKFVDGYSFTLQCPRYPSFTGNYAVGNETAGLIIWPGFFARGDTAYGLELYSEQKKMYYRFYVDSDMKFLDVSNNFTNTEKKIILSLLDKYNVEIKEIFQLAVKEWSL
jgi:hypothetical protein